MEEVKEKDKNNNLIRGHGQDCKIESEAITNPDRLKYKMPVEKLKSEAAATLVPTTEERVQDIEKNEVTEIPIDEHHIDLDFITEN